jgi:hypothetical protein
VEDLQIVKPGSIDRYNRHFSTSSRPGGPASRGAVSTAGTLAVVGGKGLFVYFCLAAGST